WTVDGSRETATKSLPLAVPADSVAKLKLFVAAPEGGATEEAFAFTVRSLDNEGETDRVDARFERPEAGQ
ncbi:MAG TPA: cytochrome c oxidase accessory protein CcoG, partial [Allosphingosinicella sp.]